MEPILDSPWLLVPEVMKYARAGRTEVMAALADGSLNGRQARAGGRWRIHRDDVDAWLRGEPAPQHRTTFTRRSA